MEQPDSTVTWEEVLSPLLIAAWERTGSMRERNCPSLVALTPWEAFQKSKGPAIHVLTEVIQICSQG